MEAALKSSRECVEISSKASDEYQYIYMGNLAAILLTMNTKAALIECGNLLLAVCLSLCREKKSNIIYAFYRHVI